MTLEQEIKMARAIGVVIAKWFEPGRTPEVNEHYEAALDRAIARPVTEADRRRHILQANRSHDIFRAIADGEEW